MIEVKIIAASINKHTGQKIYTISCTYPRFIHAEVMTHRVFSRNASSSRAIPISRLIDMVEAGPAMPLSWLQNKPGMQGGDPVDAKVETEAKNVWILAMNDAVSHARKLKDMGVHKQTVNRILEPFAHITTIITATEWENFFHLRISPLAQPEIKELAMKILKAMDNTPIQECAHRQWHLPFINHTEFLTYQDDLGTLAMISAARCARVSYLNHDGTAPDVSKDLTLSQRLAQDKHSSVFEHQAHASDISCQSRNFRDWHQFRAMLGI